MSVTIRKIPNQTDQSTTLTAEQEAILKETYYSKSLFVGRDRLHHWLMENKPQAGISRRQVMAWLKLQKPWQLTKQPPKRQHTSIMDIRKEGYMSCDLKGPLARDQGFEYVFGLVDVASRKQYAKPIKDASAQTSVDALDSLIKENDLKITLLRSDNGTHFKGVFTEYLISKGIKQLYSAPHSPWTNRQERNWRTMFDMITKWQIANNTKAWVRILQTTCDNMNATVNRSMKTTPDKAAEGGLPFEVNKDRSQKYGVMARHLSTKSALKTGDFVRVKIRDVGSFKKDKRKYSEDVYIIVKVIQQTDSKLVTYRVSADGETIEKPTYNITDLLLVNNTQDLEYPELSPDDAAVGEISITDQREVDDLLLNTPDVNVIRETRRPPAEADGTYVIEKILSKRRFGKTLKYLVKFAGYPASDSQWLPARDINAPEIMKEFRDNERKKKKK